MSSVTGISSSSFNSGSTSSILDKQMQPVADLFGISVSALKAQTASGKTLSAIASANKVSEDDLEGAIAKGLTTNTPAGTTAVSADQAAVLATAIATGKPPASSLILGGSTNLTLLDYINEDSSDMSSDNSLLSSMGTSATKSSAATSGSMSIDDLAKALGIDSDTLKKQLSGNDTSSLKTEITKTFGKTAGLQFDSAL